MGMMRCVYDMYVQYKVVIRLPSIFRHQGNAVCQRGLGTRMNFFPAIIIIL